MKLNLLPAIVDPAPIETLGEPDLKELQLALAILGYPVGAIDGLIGPKTRTAWAEFKTDVFEGKPGWIGPGSVKALEEKLAGLTVEGHDLSTREETIEAIRSECLAQGIGSPEQAAYIVATVEWETAKTFRPVREAFWLSESWRKKNLRYFPYYGRGYVQLTWKNNYERYSELLAIDMVEDPDLALNAASALFILCHGFKTGAFTGHKITEYIHGSTADFANARRCINGTDHASDIARLADHYLFQFSG
ncbi:hypothetical protein AB4156_35190 [Cupriavidus sp. 2MCAB6]|uniref:hypothetical protein n=1 Tax=Cupriavidus sp. 2MCAB6 TaxID=3232981 RepID=UPI003F8F2AFE